jgi:cysteinyl-tRNA synthetase
VIRKSLFFGIVIRIKSDYAIKKALESRNRHLKIEYKRKYYFKRLFFMYIHDRETEATMKVFNSFTGELEEFHTLSPQEVKMYVCGITTYDSPHLGHARSAVAFDMIRRYLEYRGYRVTYVQNYTDVDDKMINRANEQGITIYQLAEKYIAEYETMQQQLRIKAPSVRPRATQEIPEMLQLIQTLEKKGYTYEAEGSIYFDTTKMPGYPEIFRKKKAKPTPNSEDAEESEDPVFTQSDFAEDKRTVADFVLWKKEKPGEPAWDSPWGRGRPGWHLECSTMSMKYLGETIDIHGGGKDLKSPHHQNEIAQSECATGKPFCKYWLHNGFLNIDHTKMSKSLGNFITAQDLLAKFPGVVMRYYFLTSSYRKPIDFSPEMLDQATVALKRLQKTVQTLKELPEAETIQAPWTGDEVTTITKLQTDFFAAMDEDFNTAKAMGYLFGIINILNKKPENTPIPKELKSKLLGFFGDIDTFLDILTEDSPKPGSAADSLWRNRTAQVIEAVLAMRQAMRKEKNYAMSDRLRDMLKALGIQIMDAKEASTWEWPA